MRARLAARLAALGACLLLTASCTAVNGTGSRPRPTRSGSLWNPSAGQPAPPRTDTPFDVDAALLRIKRLGFTADDEPGVLRKLRGPFRAIHSHCTGSVDGHCVIVLFFHGNDYAGYDAHGTGSSSVVSQDGTTATISYPHFKPGDPMCCASGGTREYRARWTGGKVTFSPPLPGNPNYEEPSP
ncbi:LppP/LprE family lipoprotein [Streptomyces cinnamoneus]|uniref:LppP/LprE family lipoprotein n=1 Tax=Streptomyces cinnamoneus TaxID=53446 RepID=UPI0033EFE446